MKVLVLSRLFSGVAQSLESGQWRPEGVPAIARLLEGLQLDPSIAVRTVFAATDRDMVAQFPNVLRGHFSEIGTYEVWPWRRIGGRPLDRLVTNIEHIFRALWLVLTWRPSVVYATFGLINVAAVIARFRLTPVVVRLMGIFPYHRSIARSVSPLDRWALRSRFRHVVCTQEGSGPEQILPQLLRAGVPSSIMLNGVDRPVIDVAAIEALKSQHGLGQRPVVLFVGRLEVYKGCFDFLDAAEQFLASRPDSADFVLVGNGAGRRDLERQTRDRKIDGRVHFVGSVATSEVWVWLKLADIYVSMNRHGNLSNANLEALSAGACVVIPTEDRQENIDISTAEILPSAVVPRYDRTNPAVSLAATLLQLTADPAAIAKYKEASSALAREKFVSWPTRVTREIEILRAAAAR